MFFNDSSFQQLKAKIETFCDEVSDKLDNLEKKIEAKIGEFERSVIFVEASIGRIESDISNLQSELHTETQSVRDEIIKASNSCWEIGLQIEDKFNSECSKIRDDFSNAIEGLKLDVSDLKRD